MHYEKILDIFDEQDEVIFNIGNIHHMFSTELLKTKSTVPMNAEMDFKMKEQISKLSVQDTHSMLINLLSQREGYKEKLKIAKSAILSSQERIEKMKSISMDLPLSMNQSRIHLAFLFSSPLIRKTNLKSESIMQLDYLSEISDIIKVCDSIKHEMKYKTCVATFSNFRGIITDCPIALHFSGHGIENTPEALGNDYYLNKEKGNILLLEDEQGMSDYFFEEDLKYMVKMSKNPFEVVFVSSCYSQFAGEVFLNAGAKHVICIRAGERISDKASLRFSKVFYDTLFVKNYNVCTAFDIAKEEIKKVINGTEANKFLLLKQGEKGSRSSPHQCYALSNFQVGSLTTVDHIPVFDAVPSNVEGFVGRQQEMYEIIDSLEKHRLVSILGPPGIGKTSISRNLANYIKDRRKFRDGIVYVGLRGWETAHMFLSRISLLLRAGWTKEEYQKFGVDFERMEREEDENTDDDLRYRGFVLNVLKDKEVLVVLDNTEDPLEYDNAKFIAELNAMLDHWRKVKFLVTTRKTLNKLAFNAEFPYTLQPLSKQESLKLLISKAPRSIKNQELQELLMCTIPKGCSVAQSLNLKLNNYKPGSWTLLEHPFTALLGGHPQAISLAAPLLEYKSLKELFYDFCDSNVMDALEVSSGSKNASTSLRLSLEISVNHMKETNPDALNLFGFIGLLPGGVNDEEITQMWGSLQWMRLKDALIRASLLVYKTENSGMFVYSMLPFMSVRAYELLEKDEEMRYLYHMKCCKLFKQYWVDFYGSEKTIQQVEKFVDLETNIWACIYRGINRKNDIAYEKINSGKIAKMDDEISHGNSNYLKFFIKSYS